MFKAGRIQTGLFKHKICLEARSFGFRKKRDSENKGADQLLGFVFVFSNDMTQLRFYGCKTDNI